MRNPSQVALAYLGEQEEKGNVFTDGPNETPLGKLLRLAGQRDGESWCCYFQEGVFVETYPDHETELRNLFSANCVQTFKNFKDAGFDIYTLPKVDCLCIMQLYVNGEPTTKGHATCVVSLIDDWQFKSVEGNANSEGGREGKEVALLKRKTLLNVVNGLKVLGFVDIKKKYGKTI